MASLFKRTGSPYWYGRFQATRGEPFTVANGRHLPAGLRRITQKSYYLQELKNSTKVTKGHLFPQSAEKYLKDSAAIPKRVQKHFKDCKIETHEKPTGKHRKKTIVRVGFHSLRHSFVSLCAATLYDQCCLVVICLLAFRG